MAQDLHRQTGSIQSMVKSKFEPNALSAKVFEFLNPQSNPSFDRILN